MSAPQEPISPRPILGYMLVRAAMSTEEEACLRQELTTCAGDQGFRLAGIFVERDDSPGLHAFAGLIDALRAEEIRFVLAPTPGHFGLLPGVRQAMVSWIERETGATVLVVRTEAGSE